MVVGYCSVNPSSRLEFRVFIGFFFFFWQLSFFLVSVWIHVVFTMSGVSCVLPPPFFLLQHVFQRDKRLLFMNSSRIFMTFQRLFISLWVPCTVHETHKLHFSAIFSLKMGPMTLFTLLKIIFLQCFWFSVFRFNKTKFYPNGPLSVEYEQSVMLIK